MPREEDIELVKAALKQRLDDLGVRIDEFNQMFREKLKIGQSALVQPDPLTKFAEIFVAANKSTHQSETLDRTYLGLLQSIKSDLHSEQITKQLMIDGAPEETIRGVTLPELAGLSLQEKVQFAFHRCLLREGDNRVNQIFRAAGIDRMAERIEERHRLIYPQQPDINANQPPISETLRMRAEKLGETKRAEDAREEKRKEMLAPFFTDNMSAEQRQDIRNKYIEPLHEATIQIDGSAREDIAVVCPITQLFMVDPVKLGEHYFERDVIRIWVGKNKTNPITRLPVSLEDIKEAPEMRAAIAELIASKAQDCSDELGRSHHLTRLR